MEPTTKAYLDCRRLFIENKGRNHTAIERAMRSLGHAKFHRRILYPRAASPGWIQKYNWPTLLSEPPAATGGPPHMSVPPAVAGGSTQPSDSQTTTSTIPDTPQSTPRNPHFPQWLSTVSNNMTWTWRHQQVIIDQLEKVTSGECKRLMIFLPPRHGKSELVTVRYTAWRMQQDPATNVILGSYNQRLADRFSRKVRKVISDAVALSVPPAVAGGSSQPAVDTGDTKRATSGSKNRPSRIDRDQPPATAGGTDIFPFASSKPANSVSEWETSAGGGFRAVGVGGGVTGFGAQLIVIDDPIKSRAEAESQTYRDNVWHWFNDDLFTRLEPGGAIVLIQTRWHEDDLAGRLLQEMQDGGEPWTVINLPALSEPPLASGGSPQLSEPAVVTAGLPQAPADTLSNASVSKSGDLEPDDATLSVPPAVAGGSLLPIDPPHIIDWRIEPNIALCPERFDEAALEKIKRKLGTYSFSALYQQRPTPASGGTFKREWFRRIIPYAPPGLKWKRGYDLAVSTRTGADYTATFKCAFDAEGNLYIAGGFRQRLEFPDQRRLIIDLIRSEPDTEHGIELALHGQGLIQDLRREKSIRGHLLRGVKVETDKLSRALAWAPLAEEGKVILVRNSMSEPPLVSGGLPQAIALRSSRHNQPAISTTGIPQSAFRIPHSGSWIPNFIDEVCSFPLAAHDDQVDAVSLAVQMLKKPRYRSFGF